MKIFKTGNLKYPDLDFFTYFSPVWFASMPWNNKLNKIPKLFFPPTKIQLEHQKTPLKFETPNINSNFSDTKPLIKVKNFPQHWLWYMRLYTLIIHLNINNSQREPRALDTKKLFPFRNPKSFSMCHVQFFYDHQKCYYIKYLQFSRFFKFWRD